MDEKLKIYSILDFYENRHLIKQQYDLLTEQDKRFYKMYIYSMPFEDDKNKDLMWEFLNDWKESVFELGNKYRITKQKNIRRYQKYQKERENTY